MAVAYTHLDVYKRQHISYTVRNSGAPAEIQLRLLMDTALGCQDYAYYRVPGENGAYNEIEFETEVTDYNKSLSLIHI